MNEWFQIIFFVFFEILPEAQQGEEDGGCEEPGEGPPGHQQGQGEGEAEAQALADVDHVTQTSSQLRAGDLCYVDCQVGEHHPVCKALHILTGNTSQTTSW